MLDDNGGADETATNQLEYYQELYGSACIDMWERGLARMGPEGGSLVGISSPGCTVAYRPQPGYDLPGAGKCVMEYAMRLFALSAAARRVNVNVVVPGVTETDAWQGLAKSRGVDAGNLIRTFADHIVPMKRAMTPRDVGDIIGFICSKRGRWITGVSLPADGGVHLK